MAQLINFPRKIILHRHNFKDLVHHIAFSPDGRLISVAIGKKIQLWKTPGFTLEFAPFVLHRTLTGHYDAIERVTWSADSRFLLSSSRDMSIRVFSTDPIEGFAPVALTGHRDSVVAAWFDNDTMDNIYSVAKDGALYEWKRCTADQCRRKECFIVFTLNPF